MKYTLAFLAGIIAFALAGCDTQDENRGTGQISPQAREALAQRYPAATAVTWQSKGQYLVAHFSLAQTRAAASADHSAWFDNGGSWYMTETDITFDALPEAVKAAFAAGEYAEWRVGDVDLVVREGMEDVYVIEAESTVEGIETEIDLYYSPDGVLVRKIVDAGDDYDYEDYIPAEPVTGVDNYIRTNYPDARVVDIDREEGMTEVEIIDGRIHRELLFDNSGNWLYTKTEMRSGDVPDIVKQALAGSEYASYRIDDVDFYQTATGDYYRYELESGAGDVKVDITPEGVITVVTPDSENPGGVGPMPDGAISDFIAKKYPDATILEYDYDDGLAEVEIRHEGREKSVYFNGAGEWVKTEWDVRRSELPQAVTAAVAASQWASFEIDDVEYVQTPSSEYYRLEMEQGDREVELRIDEQGNIQ